MVERLKRHRYFGTCSTAIAVYVWYLSGIYGAYEAAVALCFGAFVFCGLSSFVGAVL
jgi:hypothetical protein